MAEFHEISVLPPWVPFWGEQEKIVIRMKTGPEELVEKSDGAAAGPQELWEALNAKYRPGPGGESFDVIYEHEPWHDEDYSEDHFLMLTRRDREEPKSSEKDRILRWAKKESPYVVRLWPFLERTQVIPYKALSENGVF